MGRASENQIITYGDLNCIINSSTSVTATGYTVTASNPHPSDTIYTISSGYKTVLSNSYFYQSRQYNIDFRINDKFSCFNTTQETRSLNWRNLCRIYYYNSSKGYVLVKECVTTGKTANIAPNSSTQTTSANTDFKISVNASDSRFGDYGTMVFTNDISVEISGGAIQGGGYNFNVYYTGTTSINSLKYCNATYNSGTLDRFLTYSAIKNLGMSTSLYVLQNSGRTTQMVVYHDFYKARYISTEYTYYTIANSAGAYVNVKTTGYTTDRIETITSAEISGLPNWLYFNGYSESYLTFVAASKTTSARSANITVTPRDCRTGITFNISQSP